MYSILSIFTGYVPYDRAIHVYTYSNSSAQHKFSVVRSEGMTGYNYVNPVRRDTVSSGTSTDNVTIRFTTDNVGPWFLHW